jgi:cytochrome c5
MRIRQTAAVFAALAAAAPFHALAQEGRAPGQTTLSIAQREDLSARALAILNERCTVCHGAQRFEARHFSEEEWNRVLDLMVGRGARLSGEEMDVLRHWSKEK